MSRLLMASRNTGKLRELRRVIGPLLPQVELLGLGDVPPYAELPETGATFADNAVDKAREAHRATGLPAVADDSGLCVAALNGMPGVFSARWAGRHGDDQANLELVLAQLRDVPDDRLDAAFVCAAAFVGSDGEQRVALGEMPGRLVRAPRGEGGFGYDPIFTPTGFDVTSAELTAEDKDALSHRGKALRALAPGIADALRG